MPVGGLRELIVELLGKEAERLLVTEITTENEEDQQKKSHVVVFLVRVQYNAYESTHEAEYEASFVDMNDIVPTAYERFLLKKVHN